jgi:hypothetical protein
MGAATAGWIPAGTTHISAAHRLFLLRFCAACPQRAHSPQQTTQTPPSHGFGASLVGGRALNGDMNEVSFTVEGNPPLKGEALSLFSEDHPQAVKGRVRALLQAAQRACQEQGFVPIELDGRVALDVITRRSTGDGTNILGGIADVLEDKHRHYRNCSHLGDLADVWLYRDDKQLTRITYGTQPGECSYTVTVREL